MADIDLSKVSQMASSVDWSNLEGIFDKIADVIGAGSAGSVAIPPPAGEIVAAVGGASLAVYKAVQTQELEPGLKGATPFIPPEFADSFAHMCDTNKWTLFGDAIKDYGAKKLGAGIHIFGIDDNYQRLAYQVLTLLANIGAPSIVQYCAAAGVAYANEAWSESHVLWTTGFKAEGIAWNPKIAPAPLFSTWYYDKGKQEIATKTAGNFKTPPKPASAAFPYPKNLDVLSGQYGFFDTPNGSNIYALAGYATVKGQAVTVHVQHFDQKTGVLSNPDVIDATLSKSAKWSVNPVYFDANDPRWGQVGSSGNPVDVATAGWVVNADYGDNGGGIVRLDPKDPAYPPPGLSTAAKVGVGAAAVGAAAAVLL